MHVKFIPSFFFTNRYGNSGSLEIVDDGLEINGRRIWSLKKRLLLIVTVFVLLLFAKVTLGHFIWILVLWALIPRKRVTDTIPFIQISEVKKLKNKRAQFTILPATGDTRAIVVFNGNADEIDSFVTTLLTKTRSQTAEQLVTADH